MKLQWFPLLPVPAIVLLAVALLAVLTWGSWLLLRKSVRRRWISMLGVLRVAAVVVFTVALLRPVISVPRPVTLSPDALVLIDTSESMAQPGASGSRLDEVREALANSPALAAAAKSHRLHWFTFDARAKAVNSGDLKQIEAKGTNTDFAASLEGALQHVRLSNAAAGRDSMPSRVLIASDGLDQGTKRAAEAAKQLGLTVDVLAPAAAASSDKDRPAVTIADVQGATRVLIGSETSLQATVRADAKADGVLLVLEEDGREIERREIGSIAAGEERRVLLTHKPGEPGLKRYTAKLARGDAAIGKPRSINVQVTDRKHDVLILEDTWRWDFKYLKRIFEDDPGFSLTALLSRGGGVYVQFGEPERRVQMAGFPRTRTELDGFETIILGNVNPETWPRGLARNIHQAVADGGKSLVVIAGPNLSKWNDVAELAQLLPVDIEAASGQPVSGRVELQLTAEGAATSWFSPGGEGRAGVDSNAGGNAAAPAPGVPKAAPRVLTLTPVEHVYPVVRKRPAASVLVETSGKSNEHGPLIVMAEQPVGRGRVLFIATDTLWQWQTMGPRDDAGVTLYTTFWQQVLRAMAPPEPTSSPVQLWLRPERTVYRTRDRVNVTTELATLREKAAKADAAIQTSASVVLPDGRRVPLDLAADPKSPARHAATFEATLAGQYRIEATARSEAQTVAESATVIEVQPRSAESDGAPVDVAGLARLASSTGGRMIDPRAADGWLPADSGSTITVTERRSFDLWQNFTLVIALCAVLGVDWATRLFRGLV